MPLYELTFEVPERVWNDVELPEAVFKAGYEDAVVGTGRIGLLGVQIEHENSDFSMGTVIADAILRWLPDGAKLLSMRQALAVSELSEEDIELIMSAE